MLVVPSRQRHLRPPPESERRKSAHVSSHHRFTIVPAESRKSRVVGASGYSGEELVRLLIRHPGGTAALTRASSRGNSRGCFRSSRGCATRTSRHRSDVAKLIATTHRIVFLRCRTIELRDRSSRRVIDLSADFRIKDTATTELRRAHRSAELAAQSVCGLRRTASRSDRANRHRPAVSDSILLRSFPCSSGGNQRRHRPSI
jgi:hypothetical protein